MNRRKARRWNELAALIDGWRHICASARVSFDFPDDHRLGMGIRSVEVYGLFCRCENVWTMPGASANVIALPSICLYFSLLPDERRSIRNSIFSDKHLSLLVELPISWDSYSIALWLNPSKAGLVGKFRLLCLGGESSWFSQSSLITNFSNLCNTSCK